METGIGLNNNIPFCNKIDRIDFSRIEEGTGIGLSNIIIRFCNKIG